LWRQPWSAPELTTADPGYWNEAEIGKLPAVERDVLVPPDGNSSSREEKLPANAPPQAILL
jgi:hypothetical protein